MGTPNSYSAFNVNSVGEKKQKRQKEKPYQLLVRLLVQKKLSYKQNVCLRLVAGMQEKPKKMQVPNERFENKTQIKDFGEALVQEA